MQGASAIIEGLLLAAMAGRSHPPRKRGMERALTALSVLLGGAGVFLAVLALDRFLEQRYAPDLAALIASAAVLAGSFLAWAVAGARRKRPDADGGLESELRALLGGLCAEFESPIRENPKTAVLLAALAGFMATRRGI